MTDTLQKELLFVYGTLLEPEIQKEAFGRSVAGEPDVLSGYEKKEILIGGEPYPIIVPKVGASVAGQVLVITPQEFKLVDDYEDRIYKRIKVKFKSGKEAWVYAYAGKL